MFLIYAAPGAVIPLLPLHLKRLGFGPLEIGWVCASYSLASLIAPLIAGQVADRWCSAEKCLSACAFLAAVVLWFMADLTTFAAVFAASLVSWLLVVPVLTLGTSLSFTHLETPENDFGRIRLWGTVGWVVSLWLMSFWLDIEEVVSPGTGGHLADIFRLSAILSVVLGIYALTLPHTPPKRQAGEWLAPAAALKLLRRRDFSVYTFVTLGLCVTLPFVGQVAPLLLKHLGIRDAWVARSLTISQVMEVTALALLPMFLLRFGTRGTMIIGLIAWTAGLVALMIGEPRSLVIASLTMNGLCVCCYLVAGQVFINRHAHGDIRASAQGLFTFSNGIGLLAGNLLVGAVRELVDQKFPPTFAVGAAGALLLTVIFFLGFPGEDEELVQGGQADEQSLANESMAPKSSS
jgi:nucleoside transporter